VITGFQHGHPPALSAQTQSDLQTLQMDMKTLQAEIPASITAAVGADQATIGNALGSLGPAHCKALGPVDPPSDASSSTPPDVTSRLTALLTAANVRSAQITQIEADFTAYQNALSTTDPTLQAKITTDKAALAKDMPAMHFGGGDSAPGDLGGTGGLLGFGP
jgi:hypothetical protein